MTHGLIDRSTLRVTTCFTEQTLFQIERIFTTWFVETMNIRLLLLSLLMVFHFPAHSAELDGRTLANQLVVGGKTLVLNGLGFRKATFLGIKVYLAGLYVEEKSQNAEQIMNSNKVRKIRLLFVRDVGAEKIKNAWKESFDENCGDKCDTFEKEIATLGAYIQDVKDGSVMDYTFFSDRIEIQADQKEKLEIKNKEFSKIMLSTWLGKKPVMEKLKTQLLGVNED